MALISLCLPGENLSLILCFSVQLLLQVLIILSGSYNFFNLLTLALCLSLLDDQHVHFWLRKTDKTTNHGRINIDTVYICISFHTHF